jgi:hypothetical protein
VPLFNPHRLPYTVFNRHPHSKCHHKRYLKSNRDSDLNDVTNLVPLSFFLLYHVSNWHALQFRVFKHVTLDLCISKPFCKCVSNSLKLPVSHRVLNKLLLWNNHLHSQCEPMC